MTLSTFIFLIIMAIGLVMTILMYIASVLGIYHGTRLGEKMVANVLNKEIKRMPAKQLFKKALKESYWL